MIRPTGLVDPVVDDRPAPGQVDDLLDEIRKRAERDERVLVTTLTKRLAEDLTDYLREDGVRARGCTRSSTRSSGSRSCASCGWASSTCWSASTCCARGSTCPRCRWWRSSTPTRRASCAARRR